jgi:hypothetical protein
LKLNYNTKHNCIEKSYEIFGDSGNSVTFGDDIYINDSSDQNKYSYCDLGCSYEFPQGITYKSYDA